MTKIEMEAIVLRDSEPQRLYSVAEEWAEIILLLPARSYSTSDEKGFTRGQTTRYDLREEVVSEMVRNGERVYLDLPYDDPCNRMHWRSWGIEPEILEIIPFQKSVEIENPLWREWDKKRRAFEDAHDVALSTVLYYLDVEES